MLQGQAGDDSLYGDGGDDTLSGGKGDDDLFGSYGNDTLYGNAGSDVLDGGSGDDILSGGVGNDTLYTSSGADILYGDAGNDRLVKDGTQAGVQMFGGDGDDTIFVSRAQSATISGGAGADRFQLHTGGDHMDVVITDWDDEVIVLRALGSVEDFLAAATVVNGNTVIDYDNGPLDIHMTLNGVTDPTALEGFIEIL